MRSRAIAGAVLSLVFSVPFAGVAMACADGALHGWKSIVVSPGTAIANQVDAHFPVHQRGLAELLNGLDRYVFLSLSINCLLYGLLLYPTIRVFLVPRVMKLIPRYSGEAFWMQQ
jgi:hypothetical protein